LLKEILSKTEILILDAAMGTELQSKGADLSLPLWSARTIVDNPDSVRMIHIENIDAGADIITTNTFRTQTRTMEKAGYKYEKMNYKDTAKQLTKLAVELALEAKMITHDMVLIAGCVAPLEDCYKPELSPDLGKLADDHAEHINNLIQSNIDFLLAETFSSLAEIKVVLEQMHNSGKDYCISIFCKDENMLQTGETLKDALDIINSYQPSAVLLNCMHPSLVDKLIDKLKTNVNFPIGAYANIGNPDNNEKDVIEKAITVDQYLNHARGWKKSGAKIIGGCCGTTTEYIKKLYQLKRK
jgi:S-methylmethionine-dependent homocysteine/selenocysteine methylase